MRYLYIELNGVGHTMGTHYDGTEQERRALNAFIALVRCVESVVGRLSPFLAESGLTETQFGVLESLHHLGPMNQTALCAKNLKSSGNMTLVVDNLEKSGLVRRVRSQEDRRVVVVHLTDKGTQRIQGMFPAHVRSLVQEFAILTAEEQETLRVLCRTLGRQERSP